MRISPDLDAAIARAAAEGRGRAMRIAFDVGGVLSKYPDVFRAMVHAMQLGNLMQLANDKPPLVELFVISDMHPEIKIRDMLYKNGFNFCNVHSADYATHGELCKAVLCERLGIDLLIDDFPGYVAVGKHVRLLVMPEPTEPYYADSWKTDGSEGNFGRRTRATPCE